MHQHPTHHDATRNITLAFFLNLVFSAIEFAGGLLTNSVAILSDAVHDLGDSVSLGVAWYLQRVSDRGRDRRFSYGYKRFSLLSAVVISVVLIVGSFFVIRESIGRLFEPREPNAAGMLVMAVFGIVVNGIAALRLAKGKSISERAVFLHMMEDVLGWVAVLVVSVVMMFVHAPVLDPILSIAISVWVLGNVYKNIRTTFKVLLQATPDGIDLEGFEREVLGVRGVESVHDVHVWSLDGQAAILTMHVVIGASLDTDSETAIKRQVHEIARKHRIAHSTLELERANEPCLDCPF